VKITNARILMNKRIKYRKFRKRIVIYNRSSGGRERERERERERGREREKEREKEKNNEAREHLANARLNWHANCNCRQIARRNKSIPTTTREFSKKVSRREIFLDCSDNFMHSWAFIMTEMAKLRWETPTVRCIIIVWLYYIARDDTALAHSSRRNWERATYVKRI